MSKQVIATSGEDNSLVENLGKVNDNFDELYGSDIEMWGDSLTSGMSLAINPYLNSRSVEEFSYGGKTSAFIRDIFLSNADKSKAQIFWIGSNNSWATDYIIDDLRTMINHLGHDRFLIMMIHNGGYEDLLLGGQDYHRFPDLEDRLKFIYPNNFLNNRKAVIQGWDMGGVKLLSSFTQPSLGQNVQINVSDANFLSVVNSADVNTFPQWDNKVRIGDLTNADLYTIVSVDSSNLITLKLDESNVISEGDTVENLTDNDGAIYYLKVVQEMDWQIFNKDATLSTFRADSIHMNSNGKDFLGKKIADFFNRKFI